MIAMIDLARHVGLIVSQLEFLARHARGGSLREEADTIAAMAQIADSLRAAATVFDHERKQRQEGAALRAERNAILMRDRAQHEDR